LNIEQDVKAGAGGLHAKLSMTFGKTFLELGRSYETSRDNIL